jgi:hypothetical protein
MQFFVSCLHLLACRTHDIESASVSRRDFDYMLPPPRE